MTHATDDFPWHPAPVGDTPADEQMFRRPATDDRKLRSIHDWYGAGVLRGWFDVPAHQGYVRHYCGRGPAMDQYRRGIRDGQQLRDFGEIRPAWRRGRTEG